MKNELSTTEIQFIDLHSHILNGLDDGAQTKEKSLKMLQAAVADGVKTIVASSHYSRGIEERYFHSFDKVAKLAETVGIELLSGCEYDFVFLQEIAPEDFISLGQSKYILIDLNQPYIPPAMVNEFFRLNLAGFYPVLAHPERMFYGVEFEKLLQILTEHQITVQVNSGSILGRYGEKVKKNAFKVLDRGICCAVANDAHNYKHYKFSQCREVIDKRYGEGAFKLLASDNPRKMLENSKVSPLPGIMPWWKKLTDLLPGKNR